MQLHAVTKAAGILFLTEDGNALFLKRGMGGDHPGEWCFPGGRLEGDETAVQGAIRETLEEAGREVPLSALKLLARNVSPSRGTDGVVDDVDFTTYLARIKAPFSPTLCDEHTGYAWASIQTPPDPLHPGCAVALERLTMDELGVARAMAAGQLTSPQVYMNVTLVDMRITGVGLAYRMGKDEYVWREPSEYLNDYFVARCNGLPIVVDHPKKATLDSKEFSQRIVGTCFVPYIKGDEVWGICKIYDDSAIKMMAAGQLSTSPSVVLKAGDVDSKITLDDGSTVLVETKPKLLDHLAICEQGVWDKGGAPSGISVHDAVGETYAMTDLTAADKARKDAEEAKEREDKARGDRMDAACSTMMDAATKIDTACAKVDSLSKRMDEWEEKAKSDAAKADEEAAEKEKADKAKADAAKADEEAAEKEKADKIKADAEAEEKADAARGDSVTVAELKKMVVDLSAKIAERPEGDRKTMLGVQARADKVYQAFGESARRFLPGEDLLTYRQSLAADLQSRTPAGSYKDIDVTAINDEKLFAKIEETVYADAQKAALDPTSAGDTGLRGIEKQIGGHTHIEYVGRPSAWMRPIGGETGMAVTSFASK